MKTYNRPITQVTNCSVSYMLMNNVSGGDIKGVHQGPVANPIEIY